MSLHQIRCEGFHLVLMTLMAGAGGGWRRGGGRRGGAALRADLFKYSLDPIFWRDPSPEE